MSGENPFADEDDDLDKTVVRPASGSPAAAPGTSSPTSKPPSTQPASPTPTGPTPTGPTPTGPAQAGGRVAAGGAGPAPAAGGATTPPAPRFSQSARLPQAAASAPASAPSRPIGSGPLSAPGNRPLGDPALVRDPALLTGASYSRLLDAAAPTLALIVGARDLESHPDPEGLLDGAIAELRAFETAALASGHSAEQIRLARYALCATLDDVVLATPWGGQTAWSSRGLVTTIHRETMSGERFFSLLDTLMAKPEENHDVLQVFYVCLSLGFEGRYRVMPRGATEISRVRDRLYRTLMRDAEPPAGPLSPAGRAAAVPPGRVPGAVVPVWLPVLLGLAVLVGVFWLMSRDWDGAWASVAMIEQRAAQPVQRAPVSLPPPPSAPQPAPPPAAAAPEVPETTVLQRIRQRLGGDLAAGLVEVLDLPSGIAVRVVAPDSFPSGSAAATPELAALARRIASALDPEPGAVVVLGHTDSVPLRAGARFADNEQLSLARAQAVAEALRPALARPDRVSVRGLGAGLPIADNASAEGRARNRRVEVLLADDGVTPGQAIEALRAATGMESGP